MNLPNQGRCSPNASSNSARCSGVNLLDRFPIPFLRRFIPRFISRPPAPPDLWVERRAGTSLIRVALQAALNSETIPQRLRGPNLEFSFVAG
jgi:hypothetical protein